MDFSALLYLNPELSADSNLITVDDAERAWTADLPSNGGPGALAVLAAAWPEQPPGSDPRVFLSAQHGVSPLNDTIRRAMLASGLDDAAVRRRGIHVATMMED